MSVVRSSKSSRLWRGAALVLGLSSITPLALAAPDAPSGVNPPASPDDAASAMHRLQDVCQQLDYGSADSRRSDGFNEPTAGPEDTLCSLNELMEKAPAIAADAVSADEVISGKTFWSLEAGAWGKQSGTATAGDHVTGAEGELSLNIPNGIYSGDKTATVTDSNLTSENIKSGSSVFGVVGSVVESTGDAIATNVLQDKTFSKAGEAGLTGSMPNNGAVTVTPSTTDQAIAAGYHDGSGKVSGDANLTADNIKSGTSVFGVTGSVVESTGDAIAANVLQDKTFSKAGEADLTGSMPNNGAVTVTPGITDQSIAAGYHDGSGKVSGDANLTADNIKSGTSVFGIAGSVVESTGDAVAANVLSDKTFSKAGTAGLTGSMPNNGAVTVTPSTTDQAIAAGYHDGSGKVSGDANLTADNIKSGSSVFGVAGSVVESTGDAVAANVLSDKTFSKAGTAGLTGSMPNNGAVTVNPSTTDQSIAAGYHDGSGKVSGDANLTAANIKSGTSVFGVAGSVVESTGDAIAANVLQDKTFSKAGEADLTGSMPNNGAVTVTPSTADQSIAAGYHDGSGKVTGDANLTADNIKSGSTVFGVTGTHTGITGNVQDTSSGDAAATEIASGKKAWVDGVEVMGTVAVGTNVASSNLSMTIPDGIYSGSKVATASDVNLIAGNIKSGSTVFGVTGTHTGITGNVQDTSSGDAAASEIASGKKAWVDGVEVTGTVAVGTNVASSNLSMTIPDGIYSGSKVATAGDVNLIASNIKSGVTIFGVEGTVVSGGNTYSSAVAATGQTTSYATGDDGDTKIGATVTGARFTDNSDGTVTDNLTGLIWLKNTNCGSGTKTWVDALTFANTLSDGSVAHGGGDCSLDDNSVTGDWRLPSIKELQSLVDYSNSGPALSTGHPFSSVQSGLFYWSSTTYTGSSSSAWLIDLVGGNVGYILKSDSYPVWPVRGGQ